MPTSAASFRPEGRTVHTPDPRQERMLRSPADAARAEIRRTQLRCRRGQGSLVPLTNAHGFGEAR